MVICEKMEKKVSGGGVAFYGIAFCAQQPKQGETHGIIVVDDVDRRFCHSAALIEDEALASGKVTRKTAPRDGWFSARILPPWASTNVRTIERPRPIPLGLVLKK